MSTSDHYDDPVPSRGKARELLRAISTGSIRQMQHLYRYFDIIAPHEPITYTAKNPPTGKGNLLAPSQPPPTLLCLATAISHSQPTALSDLLQTFHTVPVTPHLLELCLAESNVSCLDLLLMHDSRAINTCVAVYPGDRTGASLLHCAVSMSAGPASVSDHGREMARCLLHHGAAVDVGSYAGLSLVKCALGAGTRRGGQDADGDHRDEIGSESEGGGESESEDGDDGPDLELVRELVDRGASVEGVLQDAVEAGPEFVAVVLKGRPKPRASEVREALMGAKKAELVILRERMEERRKRASMESLREEAREGENGVNGEAKSRLRTKDLEIREKETEARERQPTVEDVDEEEEEEET